MLNRSHVLPQVLYLDYLQDGLEILSVGNTTIKVTLKPGGDVYFNDAKVIRPNVL